MARKKSNKIIESFKIFFSGINTFFLYFDQCAKYLTFPVIGQILALAVIFTITYHFNMNYENIKASVPFLNNDKVLYTLFYIVLLPFFLVFVKALYEYILAFSALNILFFTVSNKKKVKDIDFNANKKVIERKLFHYIVLMLVVSILLCIPPLILIAPILWIFLCLSFQVFALENDINAFKAISRSAELVKGNVLPTVILLLLTAILTYWFLPSVFVWASEKLSVINFISDRIEKFISCLYLERFNDITALLSIDIKPATISRSITETLIASIIIAYTLPYRCCCFTELYRLYDYEQIKEFSKQSDEIIARATNKKRKN